MYQSILCDAIRDGKCVELRYDGYLRVVEVHAVGRLKTNNLAMRVWQVRGGSKSNEPAGWKLLRLDKSFTVHLIDEKSAAPRHGYKPNDADMTTIFCRV